MPELTNIVIYPIKSCGGIHLRRWYFDACGLAYDRRWMLVDEQGDFLSQRQVPRMALIGCAIEDDFLCVTAPGMDPLRVPMAHYGGEVLPVRVWRHSLPGILQESLAHQWFSQFLERSCRLIRMPEDSQRMSRSQSGDRTARTSLSDDYPILMTSESSLADLNGRMAEPVGMERFRPNLVVAGSAAYAEDTWRHMRLGETQLYFAKPCGRCVITTLDPTTANKGKEPLRTLASYRTGPEGPLFGVNLLHEGCGEVEVGMPLQVLE